MNKNPRDETLYLLGSGGFALCCYDILVQEYRKVVVVHRDGSSPDWAKHSVLEAEMSWTQVNTAFLAVGDNYHRNTLMEKLLSKQPQMAFARAVHSSVVICSGVQIGDGTYVGAGSVLGPEVKLGRFAVINAGVQIEHETSVGDFTNIGTGSALAGRVQLQDRAIVGVKAGINHGRSVGKDSLVGSGAVVVKDVPEGLGGLRRARETGSAKEVWRSLFMKSVMVIAEAGVNHNGSLQMAKQLVDAAQSTGADYVKFQTYRTEELIRVKADLAEYQKAGGKFKTQYELLKSLELTYSDFEELFAYAREKRMPIFSTAFDLESLSFLSGLGQKVFKMSSGDMDNLPLIRGIVNTKPDLVIMSTGAANLSEVAGSVELFKAMKFDLARLYVLHCTTQYPCPFEDMNLKAMHTLRDKLGVSIGYSDHSEGTLAAPVAVALGAQVIEKHLTLDRSLPGPDHSASLDVAQFTELVKGIRGTEKMLGTGEKAVMKSESANRQLVRKSIVAKTMVRKGQLLDENVLTVKRPADGLSPMLWDQVVGTKAVRDFQPDESIELS